MCNRVISALRGLLTAKPWKMKGRYGGLGALDAFAKAASSLCRALAGNHGRASCLCPFHISSGGGLCQLQGVLY